MGVRTAPSCSMSLLRSVPTGTRSSRRARPRPAGPSQLGFEADLLRAIPDDDAAQLRQLFAAFDDRGDVVAGELAHLAREAGRAVGEEDLDLGESSRIEQQLPRRRVARRVLGAESQIELPAEGNPRRFTAPASLHELALEGQEAAEGRNGPGCLLLLEPGRKAKASDGDPQHGAEPSWPALRPRPACARGSRR